MAFRKHLFISYAHLDNRALDEDLPGWITYFHRKLEIRLGELLGKEPVIWRDEKLTGHDNFSDAIVSELEDVAMLVSIVSPRYLESDWCKREFLAFCEAAAHNLGLRLGTKFRVFKVVKTPAPTPPELPVLNEMTGYEFYRRESDGRIREFNPAFGRERKLEFLQMVDDLAQDIARALNSLTAPVEVGSGDGSTVFLAEVGWDMKEARDAMRRELEMRGHTVMPLMPLPPTRDCPDRIREALAQSALSVHIAGGERGFVPEEETRGLVDLQYDLAVESAIPRLVWRPPGSPEQRFHRFLSDPNYLEVNLEELKDEVLRRLEKPKAEPETPEPSPTATAEEGPTRVYLLFHQVDEEAIDGVYTVLADDLGYEVLTPVFDGTEEERLKVHRDHLRDCHGAVVYQGKATDGWTQGVWADVRSAAIHRRNGPIPAKAILMAPPETPSKKRFRTKEGEVLRPPAEPTTQDLQPFTCLLP